DEDVPSHGPSPYRCSIDSREAGASKFFRAKQKKKGMFPSPLSFTLRWSVRGRLCRRGSGIARGHRGPGPRAAVGGRRGRWRRSSRGRSSRGGGSRSRSGVRRRRGRGGSRRGGRGRAGRHRHVRRILAGGGGGRSGCRGRRGARSRGAASGLVALRLRRVEGVEHALGRSRLAVGGRRRGLRRSGGLVENRLGGAIGAVDQSQADGGGEEQGGENSGAAGQDVGG